MRQQEKKKVSPPAQQYFSRAVGKALDLLDVLKDSSVPLSLNQLALKIGLGKSSTFRLLYTLEARGYVKKEPAGRYQMIPALRDGVPNLLLRRLLEVAPSEMKTVSREHGETVSIAALLDNRIQVVEVVESPHLIRMTNSLGRIIPPHASSLGKAITAFQSEEHQEQLIRSYGMAGCTAKTITDEILLKEEYRKVRSQGYATDDEESASGGCCFGAPISSPSGEVFAAISMSLPKMRLQNRGERLIRSLRRAAAALSEQLG